MSGRGRVRTAMAALAVVLSAAGSAAAQEPAPTVPYRGLFENVDATPGAPAAPRLRPPSLTWSAQMFDFLESAASTPAGAPPVTPSFRSRYGALNLVAGWRRNGRSISFGVGGETQARFEEWRNVRPDRGRVGGDLDLRVTRTTMLTASSHVGYLPRYTVSVPLSGSVAGAAGSAPGIGVEVDAPSTMSTASTLKLARRLGPRRRVEWAAGYARATLGAGSGTTHWTASSRAVAGVSRQASLRLEYNYAGNSTRRPAGRIDTVSHEAAGGIEWVSRGSATRATLSLAPAATKRTTAADGDGLAQADWTISLGGVARVDHAISRRWRVAAAYQRALYFDERYTQPAFVQTVTASASAVVSSRITFDLSAARSAGAETGPASPHPPRTFGYSTRLNLKLTDSVSSFVEYQGFDAASAGGAGSPLTPALNRRGTRVGLTVRPRSGAR